MVPACMFLWQFFRLEIAVKSVLLYIFNQEDLHAFLMLANKTLDIGRICWSLRYQGLSFQVHPFTDVCKHCLLLLCTK